MVVSIGSRGSHIPAMTPRRKRLGVIAGMWDPLDPIETTMTLIAVNISLIIMTITAIVLDNNSINDNVQFMIIIIVYIHN